MKKSIHIQKQAVDPTYNMPSNRTMKVSNTVSKISTNSPSPRANLTNGAYKAPNGLKIKPQTSKKTQVKNVAMNKKSIKPVVAKSTDHKPEVETHPSDNNKDQLNLSTQKKQTSQPLETPNQHENSQLDADISEKQLEQQAQYADASTRFHELNDLYQSTKSEEKHTV